VKVDFMDSDSQETVQWYEEVLRTAAKYKLFVNFHGAYKPTGLARTWPNYITQEGVLGNEYNKLPGKKVTPAHTLMLVFTRGVLGPMDFTPGGFANVTSDAFQQDAGAKGANCQVMGTRARQLAMTVVYASPLLCLCDSPESYLGATRNKPEPGLSFFNGLPTVWDETQVLAAAVGSHVVIARRAGEKWYIGAINGDAAATVQVPLLFLGSGRWALSSFADTPESATKPTAIAESQQALKADETLTLHLVAGGGFAGVLSPQP
jgi:alpha-glucosidase